MVDRNLLREFDITEDELNSAVADVMGDGDLEAALGAGQSFEIGSIVSGVVIETVGDDVIVDIGYKSEGLRPPSMNGKTASRTRIMATSSRSCSKAWTTTPARSSSVCRKKAAPHASLGEW